MPDCLLEDLLPVMSFFLVVIEVSYLLFNFYKENYLRNYDALRRKVIKCMEKEITSQSLSLEECLMKRTFFRNQMGFFHFCIS